MEPLDFVDITKILKHRYPFLLVDRVLELEHGKRCKAQKNVSYNEPYFQGHFPNNPIMPGVVQIEAMAQTAGIALLGNKENHSITPQISVLAKIEKVRFRELVRPGDILVMTAIITKIHTNIGKIDCEAYKQDLEGTRVLACQAQLTMALTL